MKRLCFCLLFGISNLAVAQTNPAAQSTPSLRLTNQNLMNLGPMIEQIDTRYEGQHGSPYLLTGWTRGRVDLLDGRNFSNVPLKFDAYRQELIMLRPRMNNDSIIIARQTVTGFFLADSSQGQFYPFRRYPDAKTDDPALRSGYFLVLYAGKSALLKRVAKAFRPANYQGGYSANVRYDSFDDQFSYYLLKPDNTLARVKLSKKSLLDALGDRTDALKKYVDQQKLDFKTEADAVMLVKQFDSI